MIDIPVDPVTIEQADGVNLITSPHLSMHHNRRKMMRRCGTMKKTMATSALLIIIQMLIFSCWASSDHQTDEASNLQLKRRLQDDSGPWLPDQTNLRCTNDQKKETWMPNHKTVKACCERSFSWDIPKCSENSFEWLAESQNPDASELQKHQYYPDTTARICKLDSPERPSWITILVSNYQKCCEDHIAWDYATCMENEPVIENESDLSLYFSAIGPTTPDPTSSPTKGYSGFYPDTTLRKCLPNSPDKPAWNEDVAPSHLECCEKYLDWAFIDCVADIPPSLKPTPTPTPGPTAKPTQVPVTATVSFCIIKVFIAHVVTSTVPN